MSVSRRNSDLQLGQLLNLVGSPSVVGSWGSLDPQLVQYVCVRPLGAEQYIQRDDDNLVTGAT